MSTVKRKGDLEIGEDMDFQRKEWRAEQLGWALMLLMALAALLGLFGRGPLSDTQAVSGPLQVNYGRFERMLSKAELRVQVDPAAAGEELRLQVDREWLERYNIQRIVPEPDSSELSSDSITYVFKPGAQAGSQPLKIKFHLEPTRMGPANGRVRLEGGEGVSLSQFIYP